MAARIRERAELSPTRIILLTSGDRPGDLAQDAQELRIDARLLKPVQQEELLATIHRVLRRDEGGGMRDERPPVPESFLIPPPSSLPLHILAAEDNEFNAQLLEQLLGRRGCVVRLANNGREVLSLAEKQGPSTCCSWTSTGRRWTASRSCGPSASERGRRGTTCPSSP